MRVIRFDACRRAMLRVDASAPEGVAVGSDDAG
ncbi:MAG: hypothetical protein QOF33_4131, partial [Thermomicrobiales bacterium]|nr:hypothetical protein [Thermomicrobiales bacterium]